MLAMVKPMVDNNNQIEDSVENVNSSEQLNFFSSFKPNYYFLRALGLWPFSFVRDSNGEIIKSKITKLDLLWFIISIHLYVLASIVFFKSSKIFERENTKTTANYIIVNGNYTRLIFGLILVALSIGIDMCNRFKLANALKMFATFDKLVGFIFI